MPPTRTPLYDEATGQRFRTVREAAAATFRSRTTIERAIERIEGMRIIRPGPSPAPKGRQADHLRRRLQALYPLAYPQHEEAA